MATKEILMDGDKVCIAWFKKKKVMLTTSVDPVGGGTITPVSGQVNKGSTVRIEALPDVDYEFDHFVINGEEQPADPEG